jgi:hypothetical protein
VTAAMLRVIFAGALVVVFAAIAGYCKLTLLNTYHFRDYLASPRARRLYWGTRIAALGLGIAIANFGIATRIWFFALPLCLFGAFTVFVNARATYIRCFGNYEQFYRDRGLS